MAMYPAPGCDADILLKRADVAMRAARGWGANIVRMHSAHDAEAGADCRSGPPRDERRALRDALAQALALGQLFLEYQPQVALPGRRVIGVEALLRWRHPHYGRIEPRRFVPLLEESGMIVPVGEWVLRSACRQNRAWHAAGLPEVKTVVNLSARQLREPGLADQVLAILAEHAMPAACLEFDIAERVLMSDAGAGRAALAPLRAAGVRVALDDVGASSACLGIRGGPPADAIKLDAPLTRNPGRCAAIVAAAHRLGLAVVAEAVDSAEQCDALCALGCDAAQGYLSNRPLAAGRVAALLARQADVLPA